MNHRLPVLILAMLSSVGGTIGAGDALSRHLAYIQHIEAAGTFLDGGRPTEAIVELTKALDLKVPQSYFNQFRLHGTGATAHYLMACAHSMMGRTEESIRELEEAFANGFSNLEQVLDDPCLSKAQEDPGFKRVKSRIAAVDRHDRYGGQIVLNEAFGTELILDRKNNFPKLGEFAPEITLLRSDGSGSWTLSSLRGLKPVVLVFGSFT